jgi:hypothetical protein
LPACCWRPCDWITSTPSTEVEISGDSSILLILRPGKILTREPFEASYINRDLSLDPTLRGMLAEQQSGHAGVAAR